jgi:hypothetical protein
MPLNGKELRDLIARRKDREKEGRREAQRGLFSSKEAEMQYLYERAISNLGKCGVSLEEIDAEIARSRERRKKVANSLDK